MGTKFAPLFLPFLPKAMDLWYFQYEEEKVGGRRGQGSIDEEIQYSHPPFALLNREENRKEGVCYCLILQFSKRRAIFGQKRFSASGVAIHPSLSSFSPLTFQSEHKGLVGHRMKGHSHLFISFPFVPNQKTKMG